jgi:predicted nucleotidyltransferase
MQTVPGLKRIVYLGMRSIPGTYSASGLAGLLQRVEAAMQAEYGPQLAQLILFGSHARGTVGPDSDVDILVVLDDGYESIFTEYQRWTSFVMDILLEEGELLNLVFTSTGRWESVRSPLYQNIRKEGWVWYDARDQMVAGTSG